VGRSKLKVSRRFNDYDYCIKSKWKLPFGLSREYSLNRFYIVAEANHAEAIGRFGMIPRRRRCDRRRRLPPPSWRAPIHYGIPQETLPPPVGSLSDLPERSDPPPGQTIFRR
jgi:hypothetical protein